MFFSLTSWILNQFADILQYIVYKQQDEQMRFIQRPEFWRPSNWGMRCFSRSWRSGCHFVCSNLPPGWGGTPRSPRHVVYVVCRDFFMRTPSSSTHAQRCFPRCCQTSTTLVQSLYNNSIYVWCLYVMLFLTALAWLGLHAILCFSETWENHTGRKICCLHILSSA